MMDPVLAIIIASCMTLTQFAIHLKENISTSAYLKNFDLMVEAVQSIHSFLESTKKFKSWGSATDSAKKAFQKLEDCMRKCTGLLQRCINARSKLLQLVSDHALRKEDFSSMCTELESILLLVPTETMPEILAQQLKGVQKQLQSTPFDETITPEMKLTFEKLMKEEAAGAKIAGSGLSRFAAGQLAQQLGFEGPSAFRKEQEALALEKRKAVEGRDKAQEVVLEQVALVLVRMEKELPAYHEIQKLKASAASLPAFKPAKEAAPPAPLIAPAAPAAAAAAAPPMKSPRDTMSAAQRSIVAAVEEQLSLKEAGRSGSGGKDSSQSGSPGSRERRRRSAAAANQAKAVPPPSFQNWVVDPNAGGEDGGSSDGSSHSSGRGGYEQQQQQVAVPQQQQHAQSRFAEEVRGGGTTQQPEFDIGRASQRKARPEAAAATTPQARAADRVRQTKEEERQGASSSTGSITPHPPPQAASSATSGRPRARSFEANVKKPEESSAGGPDAAAQEDVDDKNEPGKPKAARDGAGGISLNPDLGPETDLAAYDPEAPFQVVQNMLYGTSEEQCQAAGLVGWYTMFSSTNRGTFREAGAIDALLPLACSRDAKTMEAAVGALLNLSSEEESKGELAGHLPELVQCAKRAETPTARSGIASVLRNVASTNETRAAAVDAGVVPHLVKLLNADDMSKQAAAEAIASLSKCESRRSTIVIQGAVMPLALALRSNPVPETLTAICSALACLAAVPEGREAMGLGVPSLVNVLRLDIPDALKDAVEALLLLARHSPTYRSSIRNNGGMRYLRNVLRSGPPSLHPKAMELLAALFS